MSDVKLLLFAPASFTLKFAVILAVSATHFTLFRHNRIFKKTELLLYISKFVTDESSWV